MFLKYSIDKIMCTKLFVQVMLSIVKDIIVLLLTRTKIETTSKFPISKEMYSVSKPEYRN